MREMTGSRPLVSVIIPTFNRKELLNESIRSVVRQTVGDWELIVVNDASNDGTDALLREWMKRDPRIRCEQNGTPSGGAGARNIGIRAAQGEFIAFLDDDDLWLPGKLEKQLQVFERDPAAVASSCWFTARYAFGRRVVRTFPDPGLQQILSRNVLGSASVCMVRSSVLKETGGFSDNFPSAQDWDLWVRLRMRGPIRTVREPLVEYAVHRGPRISTNLAKKNAGFRRFYLRHKSLMSNQTRCDMMSLVAYMRSRSARGLRNRLFWLARSLRWGRGFVRKAGFVFSVLMHSF